MSTSTIILTQLPSLPKFSEPETTWLSHRRRRPRSGHLIFLCCAANYGRIRLTLLGPIKKRGCPQSVLVRYARLSCRSLCYGRRIGSGGISMDIRYERPSFLCVETGRFK